MRITGASQLATTPKSLPTPAVASSAVAFQISLSAAARSVEIDTGNDYQVSPLSGTLELDFANPHVALRVRWKNPPADGERRFAKFVIEAPGKDSITHVFDASGDIDDYLELPISPSP